MTIFDKPFQIQQAITGFLIEGIQGPSRAPLKEKSDSSKPATNGFKYANRLSLPDTQVSPASHGLFKWLDKAVELKKRYEEDLRGKFETFKANGDLIAARDLIHPGGHGAFIDEKWQEEAYIALHQDPYAWMAAAESQKSRGDYLSARQHLDYALFIVQEQIRSNRASTISQDGSRSREFAAISFTTKLRKDPRVVEAVEAKIQGLRSEIAALPKELEKRMAATAQISATAQDETLRNRALGDYEKFKAVGELIQGLDEMKFERINLDALKSAAKLKLLGGALSGNQRFLSEGFQIGIQLERRSAIEPKKSAVFETWLNLSPRNSRFAFDLEIASLQGPVGPFEIPSPADVLEQSPLLKLHQSLERTGDPLAPYMEEVATEFNKTAAFQEDYDPTLHDRIFTGYRDSAKNLEELTALNDHDEKLFGSDRFQTVVDKLGEGEKRRNTDDVPNIKEDLRSMASLSGLLEKVRSHEITPEELENHRKLLISRGEKYVRFFDEKFKAIKVDEGKFLFERDYDGMARVHRQFNRWKEEYKAIQTSLPSLQNLKNLGVIQDAGQIGAAEKVLRESAGPMFAAAETQMRSLLTNETEELGKKGEPFQKKLREMPLLDPQSLTRSEDGFDSCRESASALVESHLKQYQGLSAEIDQDTLKHAVDDSITSFKQARTQSHRADLAEQFFKPFSDVDFSSDGRFETMIDSFKSARKLLDSTDPTERERGANAARLLFGTSLGKTLQGKIRSSQWFDRYVVGPGVMLASAAVSMTVLRFAGPIVGRFLSAPAAARFLFWTNAAAFTVSNHIINGKIHGIGVGQSLKSMATHPGSTIEEVVITGAMMRFLKPLQGTVSGLAAKSLGWRGLALTALYPADLAVELGGLHVFNHGVLPLYENLKTHGLVSSLKSTWSELKHPKIAREEGLLAYFAHEASFLALLHVGGAVTSPAFEPLNQRAENLGARMAGLDPQRLSLDAGINRLVGALGDPSKIDKKDLIPVLDTLANAYRKQRVFLESKPQELRKVKDIEELNRNGQALENVLRFRDIYARSVLMKVAREGARNKYGVTFHASREGLFNITSYAASKGVELIRDLKADPAVSAVDVHPNGLVVVTLTDPLGQPMTWRMVDRGGALDILTMKREAARGGNPVEQTETQIPQNHNNEPEVPWSLPAKVAGAMGN